MNDVRIAVGRRLVIHTLTEGFCSASDFQHCHGHCTTRCFVISLLVPEAEHKPVRLLLQVRCIATARVLMPKSVVRLSAGRLKFGFADQVRTP